MKIFSRLIAAAAVLLYRPLFRFTTFALVLVGLPHASPAQSPPLWGDLKPGPYRVGYRAMYLFDRSRVFSPEFGFDGKPVQGDRDRPLQVRIWYPAQAPREAERMPYGDYLSVPADGVPANVVEGLRDRTLFLHRYSIRKYSLPEGLFERLVTMRTAAVKEAAPAQGRFPVVIYGGGAEHSTEENTVLWEYLASHGYVVASVPSMGLHSVSFKAGAAGLETEARDMEFLLGYLHAFPSADPSRLAAMGFSYGGAAALVIAMRNPEVDAVVGFDPSFISKRYGVFVRSSPYFDIESVKVPILEFHARNPDDVTYELTDALRYSKRYSFDINGLIHVDFNSYPLLYGAALGAGGGPNPKLAAKRTAYEEMLRYTLAFLDTYVKRQGSEAAPRGPIRWEGYGEGEVQFRYSESLPPPPSASDLLSVIREEGIAHGESIYRELRRRDPGASVLAEPAIDFIGYTLLDAGKTDEALRVFGWNAEAYPRSASAQYGVAEAYKKKGEAACAARAYRKALELLPSDTTTGESDKETIRRGATEYLKAAGANAPAAKCDVDRR